MSAHNSESEHLSVQQHENIRSQDNSVSFVTRLRNTVCFLGRWGQTFLSLVSSLLALLPSQSPTERLPGTFPSSKAVGI